MSPPNRSILHLPARRGELAATSPDGPATPPAMAAPTIDSRQLFRPGQSTVLIEHGGQRYTLRLTRENKLILTK